MIPEILFTLAYELNLRHDMELRIIVRHFSFLLCTEVFQITKDVSVKVVKSVHDHYKSKSDEKSCVIIEGGARSTRPVHIALVSVNMGCSRKLVAVAFSCMMSLLIQPYMHCCYSSLCYRVYEHKVYSFSLGYL